MPIKTVHHMLLGKNESVMCTDCKKVMGHMDNMYLETVQVSGGSSEVTETLCEICNKKRNKR